MKLIQREGHSTMTLIVKADCIIITIGCFLIYVWINKTHTVKNNIYLNNVSNVGKFMGIKFTIIVKDNIFQKVLYTVYRLVSIIYYIGDFWIL